MQLPQPSGLPARLQEAYVSRRSEIRLRLADFADTNPAEYFYELCFCLCTPQSKAIHADSAISRLKAGDFKSHGWDPTQVLRNPEAYIRFHTTKASRLLSLQRLWPKVQQELVSAKPPLELRTWLVDNVMGLGMKEASHFMRNIGYKGLAIIDRHLITNLIACGIYDAPPKVGSRSQYLRVEEDFRAYSVAIGIDMDELDLLFWSMQTGVILK